MQAERASIPSAIPVNLARLRGQLRERAESVVATLVLLQGTAEVDDQLSARPREAEAGVRLAKGTTLHVKTGRALVRLDDGSDVWLAAGARLDLSPWSQTARAIALRTGRLLALVATEVQRPFRTLTPIGEILVTGTAFEAHATPHALDVAVLHGSVEVAASGSRVRASRGREVSAALNQAPVVSRMKSGTDRFRWVEGAAASASNTRIQPAFAAVSKTLGAPAGAPAQEKRKMNGTVKIVAGLAVVALVAGGMFFSMRGGGGASSHDPALNVSDRNGVKTVLASAPNAESKAEVVLRTKDGGEIRLDPDDKAAVDAALAKLPPEAQDRVRKALAEGAVNKVVVGPHSRTGGDAKVGVWAGRDEKAGPGLNKETDELLSRELSTGLNNMREMIKSGMKPEDAKKAVEAAMTDSLRKQLGAQLGEDAHVVLDMDLTSDDIGENANVSVGIMVGDPEKANAEAAKETK
ncbi:FecR domain-containing protein [Candidatus Poribacteria bacterium]|nr:FecR domain-containing protein [Candidatus Poribacteria bacterium]